MCRIYTEAGGHAHARTVQRLPRPVPTGCGPEEPARAWENPRAAAIAHELILVKL